MSVEQRTAALTWANVVRTTNASLRREIEARPRGEGARIAADALLAYEAPTSAMPVWRLLTAIRHVGRQKARAMLLDAGVRGPDRRIRDLTVRQRAMLSGRLLEDASQTDRVAA